MKLLHSIDSSGRKINKEYSIEDKIKYYSGRINDKSLTQNQRSYAAIKTRMLTSGIGRIYVLQDNLLGNPDYNADTKNRRLVVVAKNQNNGNVLVNKIFENPNYYRKEISTFYSPGEEGNKDFSKIPILQFDNSYIDIECRGKIQDYDNNEKKFKVFVPFNINDLNETTSTIDPFDLNKIQSFIFSENSNNSLNFIRRNNRFLRNKLHK